MDQEDEEASDKLIAAIDPNILLYLRYRLGVGRPFVDDAVRILAARLGQCQRFTNLRRLTDRELIIVQRIVRCGVQMLGEPRISIDGATYASLLARYFGLQLPKPVTHHDVRRMLLACYTRVPQIQDEVRGAIKVSRASELIEYLAAVTKLNKDTATTLLAIMPDNFRALADIEDFYLKVATLGIDDVDEVRPILPPLL
jgi:hypothetical protein